MPSLKPRECHGAHITLAKTDDAAATLHRLQPNDFANLLSAKQGPQLVDTVLILANIIEEITRALKTYLHTYTPGTVQSVRSTH